MKTHGFAFFTQRQDIICLLKMDLRFVLFCLFVSLFVYVLACLFVCFVLFFAMKERIDVLSKSCGYHHSKHSFFIMPSD